MGYRRWRGIHHHVSGGLLVSLHTARHKYLLLRSSSGASAELRKPGGAVADDDDAAWDELTPIQRRRMRSSLRIREGAAERVVYQHTVLCQTVLPYRNPGDAVREWEREQGAVAL